MAVLNGELMIELGDGAVATLGKFDSCVVGATSTAPG